MRADVESFGSQSHRRRNETAQGAPIVRFMDVAVQTRSNLESENRFAGLHSPARTAAPTRCGAFHSSRHGQSSSNIFASSSFYAPSGFPLIRCAVGINGATFAKIVR